MGHQHWRVTSHWTNWCGERGENKLIPNSWWWTWKRNNFLWLPSEGKLFHLLCRSIGLPPPLILPQTRVWLCRNGKIPQNSDKTISQNYSRHLWWSSSRQGLRHCPQWTLSIRDRGNGNTGKDIIWDGIEVFEKKLKGHCGFAKGEDSGVERVELRVGYRR